MGVWELHKSKTRLKNEMHKTAKQSPPGQHRGLSSPAHSVWAAPPPRPLPLPLQLPCPVLLLAPLSGSQTSSQEREPLPPRLLQT